MADSKTTASKQPDFHVYTPYKNGEKTSFLEIGAAWKNRKDGYSIRLKALPINGELVLFPPRSASSD